MKLIVITVIGVLLLAVFGAVIGRTTTETAASPAEASPTYQFYIPATATHSAGTLNINLADHKFVFDGTGEPGKVYYLQYTLAGKRGINTFASIAATSSGTLHMEGMWIKKFGAWAAKFANARGSRVLGFADAAPVGNQLDTLASEPTFSVSVTPPPVSAKLNVGAGDLIYRYGAPYERPFYFDALGSAGMLYELYTSSYLEGPNRLRYSGSSQNLNPSPGQDSATVNIVVNATLNPYAYADLYAYDSLGNSAHQRVDLYTGARS